ncbi:IclR family transcriptional regulator [Chryseotalea sanaruensis]|uniref:IclR family transcriptional regulator n=1 Tax=Chryseotalea sanaruensis TaxID=2482724 RepID=A0A401U6E4_9BACT|nr:IclR family transcriptional regulator [Chryseotalea sanaruensis]GCC50501.1 IclR family transcriptional regulator [Chryseotalea sanaruensis]
MNKEIKKSDFVQSLEKGLNVINAFDMDHEQMTLSDVAKKVDLTRANARRILLTLQHLGYVTSLDGKLFSLTPKVLSLGYSYLSGLPFRELAQPYMQELAKEINESCSMSVLDNSDIVYIARVHTKRIMTISLGVGTRLPAHATSMGKVLLASMDPMEAAKLIGQMKFEELTPFTLSKNAFIQHLDVVRKQGWAISDQELEIGVRSIACPIRDKKGKVIAAINISGHASRVTLEDLVKKYLSALKDKVEKIEHALINL